MNKKDMIYKNQAHNVRAEKDALSLAKDNWVIGLHYTFQDDLFLYMVMDYLPGGDLMTHLQRKDIFSEVEARFYTAELVQAVDYIHTTLQYIHRDIKPDNVVFDARGHIRVVDFGCCKRLEPAAISLPGDMDGRPVEGDVLHTPRSGRGKPEQVWGAPPYVAPEVHRNDPYGKECDWWSVGVVFFEMLFGGPPFVDAQRDSLMTAARVMRWRQYFQMPRCPWVTQDERDLLRNLICDASNRLSADGIRSHPFFRGLDFSRLRDLEPPIRPVVNGCLDTSNFDDFDSEPGIGIGSLPEHA